MDKQIWDPFASAIEESFIYATGRSVEQEPAYMIMHRVFQSRETISFERENLSWLDFLGDVGALQGALTSIAGIFLGWCKIGIVLNNSLVQNTFRERDTKSLKTKRVKISFLMWLRQTSTFKLCCKNFICRDLKSCCRWVWCPWYQPTEKPPEKSYSEITTVGLRRIEREMDIVYFLRKQFILNALIKSLTTKSHRRLARRQYEFMVGNKKDVPTSSESSSDPDCKHMDPVQVEMLAQIVDTREIALDYDDNL